MAGAARVIPAPQRFYQVKTGPFDAPVRFSADMRYARRGGAHDYPSYCSITRSVFIFCRDGREVTARVNIPAPCTRIPFFQKGFTVPTPRVITSVALAFTMLGSS